MDNELWTFGATSFPAQDDKPEVSRPKARMPVDDRYTLNESPGHKHHVAFEAARWPKTPDVICCLRLDGQPFYLTKETAETIAAGLKEHMK